MIISKPKEEARFFMLRTILDFSKITRNLLFVTHESFGNVKDPNDRTPNILFVITVLFYIIYQLAMQPGWILGGEMWAEMATNYFPNANSPSYFQKLFATDAGYIPAPQRLIALVGNVFNLPAASIPYFYTWSAILLTGMMIGSFCLAQFRALIKSDALRFLTAIAVLIVADFETRTFINFTYFSAFFIAITTALALINDIEEVPWWAWFIPILLISKPAVLAALPAMVVVAMVSKARFRWITIAAVVLCIGQIAQMAISQQHGIFAPTNEISFISKIITSFKYFFGFLGGYILGPNFQLNKYFLMLAGIIIMLGSGFVLLRKRNNAGSLVLVGLSLLFFNVVINSFALSEIWNGDMAILAGLPLYRHIIVGFFGCILVVSGLFASLADKQFTKSKSIPLINFGVVAFIFWFFATGWFSFGGRISKEPMSPIIKNSHWQGMSSAIDTGVAPLCVPIDPFGWVYSNNYCRPLNSDINLSKSYYFEVVNPVNDSSGFEIKPPSSISDKTLVSFAVLARPHTIDKIFVSAKAILTLVDGSKIYYVGEKKLDISGGLVLITGKDSVPISKIFSIRVEFSSRVEVSMSSKEPNKSPNILWMGY